MDDGCQGMATCLDFLSQGTLALIDSRIRHDRIPFCLDVVVALTLEERSVVFWYKSMIHFPTLSLGVDIVA